MNQKNKTALVVALLPVFVLGIFVLPLSYAKAGCLNCSVNIKESPSENTDVVEEETTISKTSSRNVSKNVTKLDGDIVKNLVIPILFSVALEDITPNFGEPRDGGTRTHEGLDMLAPKGTPIITPTDAVVLHISKGTSAGNYVTTANPGDETFTYMHLNDIADLEVGEILQKGELVGYVGTSGNAESGPAHLHLEIRENRKLRDPFSRITRELSLETKMHYLDDILDENSSKSFLQFLVKEFESVFVYARINNIEIPSKILKVLPEDVLEAHLGTNELTMGSRGVEVSALQSVLITQGFLNITEPTGYFGPLTKTALVQYQRKHNISPATGTYGSLTQKAMQGTPYVAKTNSPVSVSNDEMSLTDLIKLLLAFGIIDPSKEALAYAAIENV